MSMNDLKWPAVVVIVSILAVLGGLSYMGKDPTPVLGGILAILAAMGFGYTVNRQNETQATVATIKEQTNGGNRQLMQLMEQQRMDHARAADQHRRDMKEMADKLAAMMPVAPVSGIPALSPEEDHSSNV